MTLRRIAGILIVSFIMEPMNSINWSIVMKLSERNLKMTLTLAQKLLIYGLTQFSLSEEDQELIFFTMKTEEEQLRLIAFLKTHPNATTQEIYNAVGQIIESTNNK